MGGSFLLALGMPLRQRISSTGCGNRVRTYYSRIYIFPVPEIVMDTCQDGTHRIALARQFVRSQGCPKNFQNICMKDQGVEDQYLWQEKAEIKDSKELVPLGVNCYSNLVILLDLYTNKHIREVLRHKFEHNCYDPTSIQTPRFGIIFGIDERILWSNGLAAISTVDNATSDVHYFKNRYYLLTLLIVCTSGSIYQQQQPLGIETSSHIPSPFLQFLTNKRCPLLKCLIFSLLNSILSYDCDGYMVPYANNIHRSNYVDRFFRICIEVLLILVGYKPAMQEIVQGVQSYYREIYQKEQVKRDTIQVKEEAGVKEEQIEESKGEQQLTTPPTQEDTHQTESTQQIISPEEQLKASFASNEALRLLSAIQGFSNSAFFESGLCRLLKNYVRPYKTKLPGPSYYKVPFHRELSLLISFFTLKNPQLIGQMIKLAEERKVKDQFSILLGKFVIQQYINQL